ncbi:unnamed protein product [Amoebophrya sp. A25]|nr:unnamed protein product [Amoebophrya sp. A25]|eukprot:GSA25T00002361001.1
MRVSFDAGVSCYDTVSMCATTFDLGCTKMRVMCVETYPPSGSS